MSNINNEVVEKVIDIAQLLDKNNFDKYYANYFGKIVRNSATFFPILLEHASTILCQKIGDLLLFEYKKYKGDNNQKDNMYDNTLSVEEISGLQYLGVM